MKQLLLSAITPEAPTKTCVLANMSVYHDTGLAPDSEWTVFPQEVAVLNSGLGLTPIIPVFSKSDITQLKNQIEAANKALELINTAVGLGLPLIQDPFFVLMDGKNRIQVRDTLELNRASVIDIDQLEVFINHNAISLWRQLLRPLTLLAAISEAVPLDPEVMEQAMVVTQLNNKARALTAIGPQNPFVTPKHIILSEDELSARMATLTDSFMGEFATKHVFSSGFMGSVLIRPDMNVENAIVQLLSEAQEEGILFTDNTEAQFIAQEWVEVDPNAIPNNIGVNLFISDSGVRIDAITTQMFKSVGAFAGTFWDDEVQNRILSEIEDELLKFGEILLNLGVRGPCNIDLVKDTSGNWVDIGDLNIRMTGAFPTLAFREILSAQGIEPTSIAHLGWGGKITCDLSVLMGFLENGGLKFCSSSKRGVVPVPSLMGSNKFDLIFVGMSQAEIAKFANDIGNEGEIESSLPELLVNITEQ
jgi:hypothetical protein